MPYGQHAEREANEIVGSVSLTRPCDSQRQTHVNRRTFARRAVDAELALQLADALAHSSNADTEKRISAIAVQRRGHSNAVVADRQADLRRRAFNGDLDRTRFGVAVHVGE